MDVGILNLLQRANLSDKESRVYLSLLELGRGTVAQISKKSGLKRSIIYVTLEILMRLGYVTEISGKKVNTYAPSDPTLIASKLTTTAKDFLGMLPYLQTLSNKTGNRPRIEYFESPEAIWSVYEDTSRYRDVFLLTSYKRLALFFPKYTDEWIRRCTKGVFTLSGWRHLIPKNDDIEIVRRLNVTQNTRVIDEKGLHTLDFAVYGNKVSITSLEEKPFAVVFESQSLAVSLRALMSIIWKSSTPIRLASKHIKKTIFTTPLQ